MNRFILIGGCQEKANLTALSNAVFANIHSPLNFLICLFARNPNTCDWDNLFDENKIFFTTLSPKLDINFILANEFDFIKQVETADIIFFSGGDSIPLYSTLARIGNEWISKIKNKTVIGTSAGTDLLSKYNYDLQQYALADGMGLVPIKTIVHYGEKEGYYTNTDWENVFTLLKSYREDLPIYPLREGEFVTVNLE